jgi:hypothetical protein
MTHHKFSTLQIQTIILGKTIMKIASFEKSFRKSLQNLKKNPSKNHEKSHLLKHLIFGLYQLHPIHKSLNYQFLKSIKNKKLASSYKLKKPNPTSKIIKKHLPATLLGWRELV